MAPDAVPHRREPRADGSAEECSGARRADRGGHPGAVPGARGPGVTWRHPPPGLGDRLLAALGKPRAVRFPAPASLPAGSHLLARAEAEPLWRALLRPRGRPAPPGWVYWGEEEGCP
jgi:hypothetical protein